MARRSVLCRGGKKGKEGAKRGRGKKNKRRCHTHTCTLLAMAQPGRASRTPPSAMKAAAGRLAKNDPLIAMEVLLPSDFSMPFVRDTPPPGRPAAVAAVAATPSPRPQTLSPGSFDPQLPPRIVKLSGITGSAVVGSGGYGSVYYGPGGTVVKRPMNTVRKTGSLSREKFMFDMEDLYTRGAQELRTELMVHAAIQRMPRHAQTLFAQLVAFTLGAVDPRNWCPFVETPYLGRPLGKIVNDLHMAFPSNKKKDFWDETFSRRSVRPASGVSRAHFSGNSAARSDTCASAGTPTTTSTRGTSSTTPSLKASCSSTTASPRPSWTRVP